MKPGNKLQDCNDTQKRKVLQKWLLICGILSSLLYIGTDILAAIQWEGYSYVSQSVSELQAIGAPTRTFVVSLFSIYNILLLTFGLGVWVTDYRKRARLTGLLLIGNGLVGFVALVFFPMHLRGEAKTISDVMHAALTGILVLLILLSIGLEAALHGRWFRFYSIFTILLLIIFGVLAGFDGQKIVEELPTPWLGITERINIFGYQLWVIVLAARYLHIDYRNIKNKNIII